MIPSNSLAAVYGIAADCAERRVLGDDVDIDIAPVDEMNSRVDIAAIVEREGYRAAATGTRLSSLVKLLVRFGTTVQLEKVHPLQDGILRMKHPSERRPGLPAVNPFLFWPKFVWETLYKQAVVIGAIITMVRLMRSIQRNPAAQSYMDQALTPVRDDDDDTLDLMTKTGGARAAVAHIKRISELTHLPGAA